MIFLSSIEAWIILLCSKRRVSLTKPLTSAFDLYFKCNISIVSPHQADLTTSNSHHRCENRYVTTVLHTFDMSFPPHPRTLQIESSDTSTSSRPKRSYNNGILEAETSDGSTQVYHSIKCPKVGSMVSPSYIWWKSICPCFKWPILVLLQHPFDYQVSSNTSWSSPTGSATYESTHGSSRIFQLERQLCRRCKNISASLGFLFHRNGKMWKKKRNHQ